MEQTLPTTPKPSRFTRFKQFLARVTENPVIHKELRKRMRGRQAFALLIGYLALISLFIALIYGSITVTAYSNQFDPSFRQGLGKAIFGTVVLVELLLISLISPALTAGAIAAERERQTFELLRTTLLSARALVFGKLGAALSYIFLLIFAAVPLESLAFLLGGVGLAELLISSLLLVVTAFFFCTLGLFISSLTKRTSTATVASYSTVIISTLILGVLVIILISFTSSLSGIRQEIANLAIWLMISLNPLLTAIFSEVLLIDSQALFYTTNSLFGGANSLPLPSPWILYTLMFTGGALVMLGLSISFVDRPDR